MKTFEPYNQPTDELFGMNLIVAIKQLSNLDHAVPFQFSKEKWQVIFPNSEPPKIDDPTDLYEFEVF